MITAQWSMLVDHMQKPCSFPLPIHSCPLCSTKFFIRKANQSFFWEDKEWGGVDRRVKQQCQNQKLSFGQTKGASAWCLLVLNYCNPLNFSRKLNVKASSLRISVIFCWDAVKWKILCRMLDLFQLLLKHLWQHSAIIWGFFIQFGQKHNEQDFAATFYNLVAEWVPFNQNLSELKKLFML